ncbi:sugar phosphate isomerase/epimerase family protein [Solibacillus daqui]|uniref:sugar phosphate isomerase/epimerase family protein n=1 Tax=Solibacillus daqui TaxID=2912187 RepID=UPI00236725A6|nr:sugar phosphate isomerase/epimerase [Solibacillus daqui]
MKIGLSTYSMVKKMRSGEMNVIDVLHWVKENGGEHVELVPYEFTVVDNYELAEQIKDTAAELGLELSGYSLPANFVHDTEEALLEEVERLKKHIDVINFMGIKVLRHDVTLFTIPKEDTSIHFYNKHFDKMVRGSQLLADYAKQFGITTTIENHGFNVQTSDRVQSLIHAVNRDNFKTTLDVGNFLCIDEEPLVGVQKNIPYAARVHFKDFYIRPYYENPGGGEWFHTVQDNYIRGAIIGHGDIKMREVIKIVKGSGYDGYLTVEFEGMEDCALGSKLGMENLKRLWNECVIAEEVKA